MEKGFVKFECGCVGLIIDDGSPIVVHPCDSDGTTPLFFYRRVGLGEKTSVPLSDEEANTVIDDIGRAIAHGDRYDNIRALLGVK